MATYITTQVIIDSYIYERNWNIKDLSICCKPNYVTGTGEINIDMNGSLHMDLNIIYLIFVDNLLET